MTAVLVVSPHPDDEAIGCGGAIRAHATDGDDVHVVFLTSGEGGGHGEDPDLTARRREQEAEAASAVLGVAGIELWRLPDGGVRATEALASRLAARAAALGAELVYAPHGREQHPDHRAAARLAARAFRGEGVEVRGFEVWTPLDHMDHIVDISPHIDDKIAAIRCYRSQCDVVRFDDAALGLARWRGELHSWPGGPYAEVFAWP
jgi:LmbE family N-acetylglucosaminyl deacetylase